MNTDLIKAASTLIVSTGVGAVVGNAIKATTPENMKTYHKVSVLIGTAVVSAALSDVASAWASKQIDELARGVEQFKAAFPAKKK